MISALAVVGESLNAVMISGKMDRKRRIRRREHEELSRSPDLLCSYEGNEVKRDEC